MIHFALFVAMMSHFNWCLSIAFATVSHWCRLVTLLAFSNRHWSIVKVGGFHWHPPVDLVLIANGDLVSLERTGVT